MPGAKQGIPRGASLLPPPASCRLARPAPSPVTLMGAHAAVMGVKFYTGNMFPKEYQNTMFIARRGSWNRNKPNGFDVVNVRASADGKGAKVTPFLTGFSEDKDSYKFWGRPVYIAQMPDGALLVSDEQVGAIYRISYGK